MSCMMTNPRELSTLAAYVSDILNQAELRGTVEGVKRITPPRTLRDALEGCRDGGGRFDETMIYNALYMLNSDAYSGRYKDAPAAGEIEPPVGVSINDDEATRGEWMPRLYFLLKFFVYQCNEDATEGRPLLRGMSELCDTVAHVLANDAAKASGCKWGQF